MLLQGRLVSYLKKDFNLRSDEEEEAMDIDANDIDANDKGIAADADPAEDMDVDEKSKVALWSTAQCPQQFASSVVLFP